MRRRRRESQDALGAAIERARSLWDRFLGACTERDRHHLAGNVAGVLAVERTIKDLDQLLTAAEARMAQLDAVVARERGPRARARSRRVHHIQQPLGAGRKLPRPALTAERGEERSR